MTQAALADTAFSKSFVSQVEHGRIHPSLSSLQHFSNRLDIRLAALLGEPTELELAVYLTDLALELGMDADAERLLQIVERCRRNMDADASASLDRAIAQRRGALALIRDDTDTASRLLQQSRDDAAGTEDSWWDEAHKLLWEGRLALAEAKPLWAARAWEGCLQLCEQGARRAGGGASKRAEEPPTGREGGHLGGVVSHPPWGQPAPLRARALAHLSELHRSWGEERSASEPFRGDNEENVRPLPRCRERDPLITAARARIQWAGRALDDLETRQAEFWAAQADGLIDAFEAQSPVRSLTGRISATRSERPE